MIQQRDEEPEYPFCARCHEHTAFERDDDTGRRLVSVCCGWEPIETDPEPLTGTLIYSYETMPLRFEEDAPDPYADLDEVMAQERSLQGRGGLGPRRVGEAVTFDRSTGTKDTD